MDTGEEMASTVTGTGILEIPVVNSRVLNWRASLYKRCNSGANLIPTLVPCMRRPSRSFCRLEHIR